MDKVSVKLTDSKGTVHRENEKYSLGDGHCLFPFKIKGKDTEYTECIKKGDDKICATKLSKKGEMKRYAFCEEKKTQKKKKIVLKKKIPEAYESTEYSVPKLKMISPEVYELPNRKNFVNFIDEAYSTYRAKPGNKFSKSDKFTFFNHQKLVRDYLQNQSPYRGLLLYHGLGVGKTCASIAIAEAFKSNRDVVVLLNKSLKANFKENLMKCGFHYFRLTQHWFFKKVEKGTDEQKYAKYLGIPARAIKKNGGAWFVNFEKSSNYAQLSGDQQTALNFQIEAMISDRYKFLHMDGLNKKSIKDAIDNRVLDDKVLIVDEVHNITNAMAKGNPGIRARGIKQLIMEADNLKVVFLSGTPMINNPYEVGQLFNLIRGPIVAHKFRMRPGPQSTKYPTLEKKLRNHMLTDQVFISPKDNLLTVTQVPYGFVNTADNKGVKKSPEGNVKSDDFKQVVRDVLLAEKIPNNVETVKYTAFPDDEVEFFRLFMDSSGLNFKNEELFKARVLGMVSHYKTKDMDLLPKVIKNEIIKVPMSDYQFMNYAKIRNIEITRDKNKKSKGKAKAKTKAKANPGAAAVADVGSGSSDEVKSSYRAYSRMHCSFVFPEEIPRPYPGEIGEESDLLEDYEMEDFIEEIDDETEAEKKKMKVRVKMYEKAKSQALKKLDKMGAKYLQVDTDEQLPKYSPKYNMIMNSILSSPGNAFVYTEYKTLEGIAVLGIVLKANGYTEMKLKKDAEGDYIIDADFTDPAEKTKKRFAFWGGGSETSDILRKIYNNLIDELPVKIVQQLKQLDLPKNNLYGDVLHVLLTTKTGAEGIDLHNVRQVHIIEPYWNPVRLKQVRGRAVRVNSHSKLPKEDRTVEIFTYIAEAREEQLKAEKTIQDDFSGKTSDEVLFDISQRKLNIMNTILRLIKEASMDCSLNSLETLDREEPFTCLDYGPKSRLSRVDYSYIPNILEEHQDRDRARRVKTITWKPTFVKIRGKEYALRNISSVKQTLYDAAATRASRPGDAIGEITLQKDKDGKVVKRVNFF